VGEARQQRGINRVVVAVWDFEAGQRFFEQLVGARFEAESDDGEAAAFGVRVAMAWDAGIELVSPIEGVDSYVRTDLERNGEGLKGVVFAVDDADASLAAAGELGLHPYHLIDYSREEIDARCAGRFDRYKEHFIAAKAPLSGTVLLGEFVDRVEGGPGASDPGPVR
jgi:hypothetical protein